MKWADKSSALTTVTLKLVSRLTTLRVNFSSEVRRPCSDSGCKGNGEKVRGRRSWWSRLAARLFLEVEAICCCGHDVMTALNRMKEWRKCRGLVPAGRQPYFLPGHQQVLVHVGAQEACVAVAFHQFIDVVLEKEKK